MSVDDGKKSYEVLMGGCRYQVDYHTLITLQGIVNDSVRAENCVCAHCGHKYNNFRDYQTSICDECFKRFNEAQLQPLKDALHSLERENLHLKKELEAGRQ